MRRQSFWWLFLLIPLIPILWGMGSFLYPRYSNYSDLTISHLPNAVYILQSIRNFGSVPLWSDLLMGGYALSADPLSGMWYPPNWIAILLPAPWGFNLLSALHILWGGFGMAFFLTLSGLKRPAAVFGGIAFAAMPKIFAHLAIGHVSLVYALVWLPWLLAAEVFRTSRRNQQGKYFVLPGAVLGIIALADVRAAFYAGVLYLFFWIWIRVASGNDRLTWRGVLNKSSEFLGQAGLGLTIAAVVLLPLAQFTSLSTRAGLTSAGALAFSLPFKKIFNLFIPDFGGYAEWILYPGAVVLFLVILALAVRDIRKRLAFWLIVIGICLLFAFGSNLPLMSWIGSTPVGGLLRVPARWMFIGGQAMVVVACHAFNELILGFRKPKFDPIFWMVAVCAFFIVLLIGSALVKAEIGLNLIWGTSGFIATVLLIALAERGRLREAVLVIIFPALLAVDLIGVNWQSSQYRSAGSVFQEGSAIVTQLQNDTSVYRVYSPDYAIPQLAAAKAGIEMVSAINPLQLESFSAWMTAASGSQPEGYSVAAPPLDDSDLAGSNRESHIDAKTLGLLNVKYVVANYPIINPDLDKVWNNGNAWIYENKMAMPRAWVKNDELGNQVTTIPVKIVALQPGRIAVEAEGPGNLVLSEVDYPGWKAKIDETEAPILRIANLLMGVKLETGPHQVEFVYRPALQNTGIAVSLISWILMGVLALRRRRQ